MFHFDEVKPARMLAVIAVAFSASWAAPLMAQPKCPPLPEGASCDHYHYHVSVWNVANRSYDDVALNGDFVSVAACNAVRAAAMKENQSLAEFVKTSKIDSSFLPNRYSDCHCDRTEEPSSPAFLDAKARLVQIRTMQDDAWILRERLRSHDIPGVAEYVNVFFDRSPRLDRFLREPFPPPLTAARSSAPRKALLESTLRSEGHAPAIAANISLAAVPTPATPPVAATAPAPSPAAAAPAAAQTQPSPPSPPAEAKPATTAPPPKPPAQERMP